MLAWLFGLPDALEVHLREPRRMSGFLSLKKADVRWFLSVEFGDLPTPPDAGMKTTHRSITLDGEEIDFTSGFTNLHTRVYERTLAGEGFGIEDARPSIELVHQIRETKITRNPDTPHPQLKKE
jgi:UDP-N-acetyl-2-amino-2-deoxyglucuronate dehydrogenase